MADSKQSTVIATGGKQYLVHEGDELVVDKLGGQKTVTFDRVGTAGKVQAKVLGEEKGQKLVVFKMRAKKGSRSKTGHRQTYSRIKIEKIGA